MVSDKGTQVIKTRLTEILNEINNREAAPTSGLSSDFSSSAAAALDKLF